MRKISTSRCRSATTKSPPRIDPLPTGQKIECMPNPTKTTPTASLDTALSQGRPPTAAPAQPLEGSPGRTVKSEPLATIAIVGLGYVGLPLAIQFARSGVNVIGLDVDRAKIDALNQGQS